MEGPQILPWAAATLVLPLILLGPFGCACLVRGRVRERERERESLWSVTLRLGTRVPRTAKAKKAGNAGLQAAQ